jgi:MoxR-like ATPase
MKSTILKGPAGVGKTSYAEYYAKKINAKVLYFLANEWTTNEELLYSIDINKVVLKKKGGDVYRQGTLVKAIHSSHIEPTVLIIDELDKAREKVVTLLLDFSQYCRISNYNDEFEVGNSDNLYMFITTNEKRELIDPLLRRCFKFDMKYLPREVEKDLIHKSNEYYIDDSRQFLYDYLIGKDIKIGVKQKVVSLIMKIVTNMRKNGLDVSLYEMRKFYESLFVCTSGLQVQMCIMGWLVRNDDYLQYIKFNHKGILNLANDFWSLINEK